MLVPQYSRLSSLVTEIKQIKKKIDYFFTVNQSLQHFFALLIFEPTMTTNWRPPTHGQPRTFWNYISKSLCYFFRKNINASMNIRKLWQLLLSLQNISFFALVWFGSPIANFRFTLYLLGRFVFQSKEDLESGEQHFIWLEISHSLHLLS